ncbi:MAG: hypothetical protein WAK17_12580 [Candidatus Nitrosopolaris sp.]
MAFQYLWSQSYIGKKNPLPVGFGENAINATFSPGLLDRLPGACCHRERGFREIFKTNE